MIKPQIIRKRFPSGFQAQVIRRRGFNQRFLGIIVDFGSSDPQPLPGLAHFLEHKLFAAESGDLSLEFEKMGADVN
ncbi:insulinase family protein, partial [Lactobacillus nasalidis]